jgi:hypothetical protein
MRREERLLPEIDQQTIHESIISSKDDVAFGDMSKEDLHMNLRKKRFFFNNNAMTSVSTSFVFVPTTLTQQVNLVVPAPTGQCGVNPNPACAAICLPSGYVICT